MGRIKQKGKAGAAKAYLTRSAAVKKLQCSLADFRRLCILKGIFPREPKNRKKANKGSSAPTSFYYSKDIAYIMHEPVLRKLREHKAFAKKLSRALGRGEWSAAKSLEENKPVYRLDHIIKERYPTFVDAIRDIDDALSLVSLFASLPSNDRLPPSLIENCARLSAEWQLYVMHTRSLRKIFLSIKGVYFQAEVMDQAVTWLVPYQFTQSIPSDVDVRVMLTFLELYQTLLGFVFFKLYMDAGFVYPPPLDSEKDEAGAGVDAFGVQKADTRTFSNGSETQKSTVEGKTVLAKDVKQTIQSIVEGAANDDGLPMVVEDEKTDADVGDDFIPQPSKTNPGEAASLTTLRTLASLPESTLSKLFTPYVFFLSREVSRPLFQFIILSFGGRVGWPSSSGSGSPFNEDDVSITHVVIDRPLAPEIRMSTEERERRRKRKYIQPQWVVDCVNSGEVLPEMPYSQGATLPPHLSPFGEGPGAYDPTQVNQTNMDVSESGNEEVAGKYESIKAADIKGTLDAVVHPAEYDEEMRVAELQAEMEGVDYGTFEMISKTTKAGVTDAAPKEAKDADMNQIVMSRRQRKLYEKMKYSEKRRAAEREKLEQRRKVMKKEKRGEE